jgi:hypothetical protein
MQATVYLRNHDWSGSRCGFGCHGCPGGRVWCVGSGCMPSRCESLECPRHPYLGVAVPPACQNPHHATISMSHSACQCAGVARHYSRRRRRQQQQQQQQQQRQLLQSEAQKAGAWLPPQEGEGPAAEERLYIDDGAGGCCVTFAADAAGRRVLIGRGAFSKVGVPAQTPACWPDYRPPSWPCLKWRCCSTPPFMRQRISRNPVDLWTCSVRCLI